jgi:hypothetical protein
MGGNDWCRTFSDLLAGDSTPILFLGKTDTTFKAKSGYRNVGHLIIDGKCAMCFSFAKFLLDIVSEWAKLPGCQCNATTLRQ